MATNSNKAVERKLCAILAADIVGYSDHMHRDEVGTFHALRQCRDVVDPIISNYGGRTFSTAGDSVVAEFPSASNSLLCAQEMQRAIEVRNKNPHDGPEILFRIGLNVGDVVITGNDLIGGGVNIAARLEALAEPGGVFLSGSVYDQIVHDAGITDRLTIEDIGLKKVKNIDEPIRVYRLIRVPTVANFQEEEKSQQEIEALQLDTPSGPQILVISDKWAIGREGSGQPVAINVTHPRVSRIGRQAQITYQDGSFSITDLDSSNGTFLNEELLLPMQTQKLLFRNNRCEISLGGGREPARKGNCRFNVDSVDGPNQVLRIFLNPSILNKPDTIRKSEGWAGLLEEASRTWVLGASEIFIGGDPDCGVHIPDTTEKGFKVAVTRSQGKYLFSSIGPAEALLNGSAIGKQKEASHGDILTFGEVNISIGGIP